MKNIEANKNRISEVIAGLMLAALTSLVVPTHAIADESNAQLAYEKAMMERELGNYQASIRAFQGILSNQPELGRARLELAVAYLQALNFAEARKQAELVLNEPGTPETVKGRIREFLAKVDLSSPRHTWTKRVSLGLMYDTNVNVGPDDSVLSAFAPGTVTAEISDHAIQLSAGVSHRFISGRNINFKNSQPAFLWLSQANYYRTDYKDEDDFDLDIISVSTGPSLIEVNKWRTGLGVQLDHVRLGGDNYGLFSALNPSFTYILDKGKTEVTIDALAQNRDYKRTAEDSAGRDSKYYAVGISMGHILKARNLSIQEGVRMFDENADAANFDNDGYEVFLGVNYRKTAYTNFYARASHKNFDYDTDTLKETQNRYVLGFNHKLKTGPLKEWVVKASYTRTDNQANEADSDYNRHQTGISLARSF